LIRKPDIYATLEIPTYWVVDRRDKSVWVHTQPRDGQYAKREHCKGRRKLPAPGLEFLHLTPARIFEA
jgi:Uma2 family endonuclease